jgi:glycerol-3-phosphate dehydrogenase
MGKSTLSINKEYNTLIIGGGIVGAGLFRDLALHHVSTLLVDQADFMSQTSSASSKMLHGGIRYLENLDFHLVHEALTEKNLWIKMAPHLCYEDAFHMPIYDESKYPLWTYRIGLNLYDFLSFYKNSPHQVLNKTKVLERMPDLKADHLTGAGVYYDAIMDDTKMGLECIYDGMLEEEAHAKNYLKLISFRKENGLFISTLVDVITNQQYEVKSKHLVFTTGPFTDQLMGELKNSFWKNTLAPSKGIHLWLKKECLRLEHPVILQTKDNRVVFVIPRNNSILVGTTETKPDANFFNIKASAADISYLIGILKYFFPQIKLNDQSILGSYAGIRPLVKEHADKNLSKVSREHKVFTPMKGLYSILGGKYTTFRVMVQGVAERIVTENHISYDNNKTLSPLRQHSVVPSFGKTLITDNMIEQIIQKEFIRTSEDIFDRRIGLQSSFEWKNNESFLEMKKKIELILNNR